MMMESEIIMNGHDAESDGAEAVQNGVVNGEISGTAGHERINGQLNCVGVEHRVKRKARRLIKQLSKEGVANGSSVVQTTRYLKNSRRPRNGFGRGLPKKGKIKVQYCCS